MGHETTKAIKASGRPRSHRSCSQTRVQEKSWLQKYLVYVSPVHKPSYRPNETSFKCYPRLSASGSFLHFSILFFPLPLIFSSPKYVLRLVPNRHEVLIAVTRGSQVLEIKDGFACSFPSPALSPLLVSHCEPAGLGEVSDLRTQRIPWQRSTLTDGRHTETDFGFGCSSGISRKFLGLVSDCILLFQSYLTRKGL